RTSEDASNILPPDYNDAVRQYCITNGKFLFDIADIEAHDPSGVEQTYESGGSTYQKLYSGYTSDGGHLNSTGAERVAMGWYAAAASQTTPPVSAPVGSIAGLVAGTAALAGAACWRLRGRRG
ncbi:MAG: hypothetical protein GY851_19490, partial [bacterium]|nr:hypothetical protein [bacterium]